MIDNIALMGEKNTKYHDCKLAVAVFGKMLN
jgi:hypothetical protein